MVAYRVDNILIPYFQHFFDIDCSRYGMPQLWSLQLHFIENNPVFFDDRQLLIFARILHHIVQKSGQLGFPLVAAVFSGESDRLLRNIHRMPESIVRQTFSYVLRIIFSLLLGQRRSALPLIIYKVRANKCTAPLRTGPFRLSEDPLQLCGELQMRKYPSPAHRRQAPRSHALSDEPGAPQADAV